MGPDERHAAILEFLKLNQEIKVDEIAERLLVSRETIRRDLAMLDSRGLLRRVHGGAQMPKTSQEAPFRQRLTENTVAKERIARAAVGLFEEDDTLFIDTGSTTEFFAEALAAVGRHTIITNSIGVALKMHHGASQSRVYLIGGEYRGETGEVLGSVTLDQIGKFRADHAVLTVGAIDVVDGLMDFDLEEAMVARAMIAQSQRVTIIADHSKFGRVAMAKVCDFPMVDRVVTDQSPADALRNVMASHGIEVIVAP
jgi:DeoR/GlpR family transcriptional regulator of sugar metabolism